MKIFETKGDRCLAERKAYADANAIAQKAMVEMRAALTEQIGAELEDCGIKIGSPVIATTNGFRADGEEAGVLRGYNHTGVTVAKRKKDGTAHSTQNIWGVKSIRLDAPE